MLGSNLSTPGPHLAFQDQGKWSVGFQIDVSDQAPDAVATSMVYKWEGLSGSRRSRRSSKAPGSPANGAGGKASTLVSSTSTRSASWVPEAAVEAVDAARAAMIAGTLDPFQGPLYRQDGTLEVSEGAVLSDDGLWGMTYFVQGAIGTMPAE